MLKQLIPHLQVRSIYEIDLQALMQRGIRGIITDLDNTLVGAKDPHATPELLEWLQLVKEMGFRVVIVSNNNRLRVANFADPISLPYIYRAKKPSNVPFRKALDMLQLAPEQTVMIGDQMMTDVFGGNRMGLYTIMVIPISRGDEGFFTKINRTIERIATAIMRRKGLIPWEDRK